MHAHPKNLERSMILEVSGTLEFKDTLREFSLNEEDSEHFVANLEEDARRSVLTTLARTRVGFNIDLVTPMIGKHSLDKNEERTVFIDQMLRVVARSLGPSLKPLMDAEVGQAAKVGPISIMLPFADRRPDLYKYYCKPMVDGGVIVHLERAFYRILSRIPKHKLRPVSLDEAFIKMPKSTNLGSPFFRKSATLYPELMKQARLIEKSGFDVTEHDDPCMLYWRGQSAGLTKPVKQRAVWGYPHKISLHELRLMIPIIAEFKKYPEFSALVSNEAVNRSVTSMLRDKNSKYCVDFSSFDQFARPLIDMAFDLMRAAFHRSALPLIDFVQDRFINIRLLTPDGLWSGEHGVPSGAGPTNWVDSMINWIIAEAFGDAMGLKLVKALFQGDDGVYEYDKDPDPSTLVDFVSRIGMYIGFDKGGTSVDTVLYLQNVHMSDYIVDGLTVGVRPLERLLSGMLGFETPRDKQWRPIDTTFRWLQQCENARYHPQFESLPRLLYQHDRLIREFSIRELIDIGGGYDEIEARQRSKGFPYGKYPLTNLANFSIVKETEKLRKKLNGRMDPRGDWWT